MCCSHSLISQKCPQQYSPTLTWPTICPTITSEDTSNTGIGAVHTQVQKNGECCLIHYTSRSLTETEKLYAVVKKDALAVTRASEKFSD